MSEIPEDVIRTVQALHGCTVEQARVIIARDVAAVAAAQYPPELKPYLPVPYIRVVLVETLLQHSMTASSGCRCGQLRLGASYPEHVADMYAKAFTLDPRDLNPEDLI